MRLPRPLVRGAGTSATADHHTADHHPRSTSCLRYDYDCGYDAPLQGSPVRLDSILAGPHETWEVTFLADNPGVWMLHCHVLLHAAMGMSTNVVYAGISTPFEMGARSGNVPE